MQEFLDNIPNFIEIAALVITIASIITSMTKSTSDDEAVNMLKKFINALALNVGKNKNADDNG
jgi:hypothetical protein